MRRFETLSKEEIMQTFVEAEGKSCLGCLVRPYCNAFYSKSDDACYEIVANWLYEDVDPVFPPINSKEQLESLLCEWADAKSKDFSIGDFSAWYADTKIGYVEARGKK